MRKILGLSQPYSVISFVFFNPASCPLLEPMMGKKYDLWCTRSMEYIRCTLGFHLNFLAIILDLWGVEHTGWTLDFPLNSWSMRCGVHEMNPGFSSSSLFNCSWSMRCAVHEMDPGFSSPSISIVLDLWVVEYTGWALDFPLNHFIDGSWSMRFSFFKVVNASENLTLLTKPYFKGFTTSDSLLSFYFDAGKQIFNDNINLHRILKNSLVIFF